MDLTKVTFINKEKRYKSWFLNVKLKVKFILFMYLSRLLKMPSQDKLMFMITTEIRLTAGYVVLVRDARSNLGSERYRSLFETIKLLIALEENKTYINFFVAVGHV